MPMLLIDVGTVGSGTEPSVHERAPRLHPGRGVAVTRVEPEDLAGFEAGGGPAVPEPWLWLNRRDQFNESEHEAKP